MSETLDLDFNRYIYVIKKFPVSNSRNIGKLWKVQVVLNAFSRRWLLA